MNKKTLPLFIILAIAVLLSGCAGHTASAEALPPIDPAAWPTPVLAQPTLPPTPFPKISLADVATPVVEESGVRSQEPVAPLEQMTNDRRQVTNDQPQMTTDPGATRNPLRGIHGQITITAVNVREGPGLDYAKLETLQLGQLVDVQATNPRRDWVLVSSSTLTGWVCLDYLDLTDAVEALPIASGEWRVAGEESGAGSQESADQKPMTNDQGQMTNDQIQLPPAAPIALAPLATAKLAAPTAAIRPGPATDFAAIGELTEPAEKLTLLAVDPTRRWALAVPEFETSRTGWVAVADLEVTDGDLTAAPEIYTGWTISHDLALRPGPGIYTAEAGRLAINNLIRVVGLNEGRSWALVQPLTGPGEGWVEVRYLTLSQKLADLPLAPAPRPIATPAPIAPALAEASAKEGRLVLQTSSGGEIMTVNADGTDLRRLTYGLDPALSPDGQTVAFTRWDQGEGANGSVWLMGIDGNNERQLLEFVKQPKGPEWSPAGTELVINYQHGGRLDEKEFTTVYDEGKLRQIPWNAGKPSVEVVNKTPYLHYHLPPDPHWGLRVINVTTGAFEDKDGGAYAFRPTWDPQETWRLVSDGGKGLVEVDVNRNYNRAITQNSNDGSPVFSPDGQYIAVTAGKPGGGDGFDIYRLNRDGGGRVQLTQTPLYEVVQPEAEGQQWSNVSPAWSPDGSQIAFLTNRTGRWEIRVMNFDGSHQRAMFTDEVNKSLNIQYNFVDERALSWR